MMRILPALLLTAAIAASASGASFMIQPAAPDTHSFVTVTAGGAWPDSCVPTGVQIQINGPAITVAIHPSLIPFELGACAPLTTLWQQTANIGLLPAGTYTVHVYLQGSTSRVDYGTQTLVVHAAEPFRVIPPGAPATGGGVVRLVSPDFWPTNQVVFGDGPAVTAKQEAPNVLAVAVPPHAAGTVDVKVGVQTAKSGLTYYDPSAPPDRSVFETILFPVALSGSGAFGSSWVTENTIADDKNTITRLDAIDPAGFVLHAGRGTLESSVLSSRIRDLSRQAESAGTQIPIVRESDWRFGSIHLTNIPADPNARMMLRIWGDHDTPVSVSIEVSANRRSLVTSVDTGLTRQANGLLYAQIDLGELQSRIPSTLPREVTIRYTAFDPDVRLWALATITNNATQQVTAIWPQ